MKKSFTLHDLPQEERPRERLEKYGPEVLSAQELLALILGRGISGESVVVTAQKILSRFGSLGAIREASLEDLMEIKGIGQAKAAQIKACIEVARRIYNDQGQTPKGNKKAALSSESVFRLIKPEIKNYAKEHFFVLSFDSRDNLLGIDSVTIGIVNENLIHPRETFEAAIRRHAVKVVIAHNHPSGDAEPSEDDLMITKRLAEAGKILGIEVLDHIIVVKDSFFSFNERGILK